MNILIQIFSEHISSFLLNMCLGMALLSNGASECLLYGNCSKFFFKWWYHFKLSSTLSEILTAPHSLHNTGLSILFLVIRVGVSWSLIVVLISVSIMTNSFSDFQLCDGHLSASYFKVSGFFPYLVIGDKCTFPYESFADIL